MEFPITSAVESIKWPALPGSVGAARLAVLYQLEQSQWWSPEKIRKQQFEQINTLLQHSVEHVPYYKKVLGNLITAKQIDQEQWLNIPLLTRDKLQQMGNDMVAQSMPSNHGKLKIQRTSGSTGKPVETLASEINDFFWNVFTLRDHLWHHRDLSLKLAVIRHTLDVKAKPPVGILSKNWGNATHAVAETGISFMINIHTPISQQVQWLQKQAPEYLLTHPSVLQALALHCQKQNIQLHSLREVRTISEAMPDGLRELCQNVWGVKVVDMYSTIELGYLALQCPEHNHYHVQSEGVLLEVLDEDGKPCVEGQVGKVVVTNLHNFATPLIRYELGDYAEVGGSCPCGRGLPVIKRILGRYRNLVTLPDGERRWPKFGMEKILAIAPVRQFQAIQHTIQEVEFRLVVESPLNDKKRQKLRDLFQYNLHPELNVSISEVDEIQRSASGKYEEFISEL